MTTVAEATFQRIARDLRERIAAGDPAPGQRLPTVPELRERYSVATATVNRATALLRSWGLAETVTGVGTLVVDQPLAVGPAEHTERLSQGLPIYRPGERSVIIEASVITTSVVSPDVLSAVDLPVPPRGMAGEATKVIKRSRVMYRGDDVIGLCRTWYNYPLIVQQGRRGADVVERLTSTEKVQGGTTYLLASLFGRDLTSTATRAGVRRLAPSLARDLAVDPGTPVLWLLETRYADDYVLEVDEWYRLGDVALS